MDIKVVLCDLRQEVVDAWKDQFEECPEVDIRRGNILESGTEALVLPGNAFGFLDRGLELSVCEQFGWEVQDTLRDAARSRFQGEILVGQAHITPLGEPFKKLVYTCLYRTPQAVCGTVNAFLAARGALFTLKSPDTPQVASVALPGMGTGSSGLHPLICARQMRYAYELFAGKRGFGDKNLTQLGRRERKLASLPKSAFEAQEEKS